MDKTKKAKTRKKYYACMTEDWQKIGDNDYKKEYRLGERTTETFDNGQINQYGTETNLTIYKYRRSKAVALSSTDAEHFIYLPLQLVKYLIQILENEKIIKGE